MNGIKKKGQEDKDTRNGWEWVDSPRLIDGKLMVIPPLSELKQVGDSFFMSGCTKSNRGPCGIPRNEFGTSPFTVGIGTQGFCKSDPSYGMECPANPNRTKERGE